MTAKNITAIIIEEEKLIDFQLLEDVSAML
jgi:hypothetical protein